jgi:hypothetical protein
MRAQKPWPPCRRGDDGDWQRFGIWAAADSLARRLYSRAKRKSDADISKSPAVRVWLRQIRASSISSSLCVRMCVPPKRRIADCVQLPPILAILQTTRWLNRDVEDRCNSDRYECGGCPDFRCRCACTCGLLLFRHRRLVTAKAPARGACRGLSAASCAWEGNENRSVWNESTKCG